MSEGQIIAFSAGVAVLFVMACIISYNCGFRDSFNLKLDCRDELRRKEAELERVRAELKDVKLRHHRYWSSIGYQEDWLEEPKEGA